VESTGSGVVTPGDPRMLADAVCKLLADPARLEGMGEAGARAAREHLSWDSVAARAESLYRSVMDEN
jgi:glycosyltransferase involved in cell wall biosynthesis